MRQLVNYLSKFLKIRPFVFLLSSIIVVLIGSLTAVMLNVNHREDQLDTPIEINSTIDEKTDEIDPKESASKQTEPQKTDPTADTSESKNVSKPSVTIAATDVGLAQCPNRPFEPGGPDPWGGCWPGDHNTGVPANTTLQPYSGECQIYTANTVIDRKLVNCRLSIRAANVVITNSRIIGGIDVPSTAPATASFTISDSSVHLIDNVATGLMRRNFTAKRVNITGGNRSIYCMKSCLVEDSWVHGQGGDPDGQAHFSGIRMEQDLVARHNTITCEANRYPGSGCSAGLTGYGDFRPVQRNLIERNLFYRGANGGSTTCAYGGSSGDTGGKPYGHLAENIRFINNRFVKGANGHCGNLRTIIDFDSSRPGNQWTGNLFHDGTTVIPS